MGKFVLQACFIVLSCWIALMIMSNWLYIPINNIITVSFSFRWENKHMLAVVNVFAVAFWFPHPRRRRWPTYLPQQDYRLITDARPSFVTVPHLPTPRLDLCPYRWPTNRSMVPLLALALFYFFVYFCPGGLLAHQPHTETLSDHAYHIMTLPSLSFLFFIRYI